MRIHDYDPSAGQAFQGDVAIIPIPSDIPISTLDEIAPVNGRLILQEGEVSGHHHAVDLRQCQFTTQPRAGADPLMATRDPALKRALGGMTKRARAPEGPAVQARLYRDPAAVNEMVRRGIMTRGDLAVACLAIEGGAMAVTHEEHDGIRLPPGNYLIGRQVESAGAEERVVRD